jgi:hypothetical protein
MTGGPRADIRHPRTLIAVRHSAESFHCSAHQRAETRNRIAAKSRRLEAYHLLQPNTIHQMFRRFTESGISRARSSSTLARPCICRLSVFRRFTWPSTGPLLQRSVTAGSTASTSRRSWPTKPSIIPRPLVSARPSHARSAAAVRTNVVLAPIVPRFRWPIQDDDSGKDEARMRRQPVLTGHHLDHGTGPANSQSARRRPFIPYRRQSSRVVPAVPGPHEIREHELGDTFANRLAGFMIEPVVDPGVDAAHGLFFGRRPEGVKRMRNVRTV